VQIQGKVQARASVYVYSKLGPAETEAAHLIHSADPSETVRELVADARSRGRPGSVLVMPHGQLTVPVIEG
jgi:hypothetical protein